MAASVPVRGQVWTRLSAPFSDGIGGLTPVLAYDWQRQRLLLWAGDRRMFDWDGPGWRHIHTANANRGFGAMLYDVGNSRMLYVYGTPPLARVQAWDGNSWQLLTGPNTPLVTSWTYDAVRGLCVAIVDDNRVARTWELTGTIWSQRTTLNMPPFGAVAFDAGRGRTVLLGSSASGGVPQETWEYDGNDWTMLQSVNGAAADLVSLVYDFARSEVLAVGNGQIRAWNGTTWTQRAANLLTGRSPQVTWDAGSSRVLWMPWTELGTRWGFQLFAWNGSSVQMVADAPFPTPSIGGGMVSDVGRGRVVMFGGGNHSNASINRNEVFEWDGRRWLDCTPAVMPPMRASNSLAYDLAAGRVLMFGGATLAANGSQTALFADLWSWDGTAWTMLAAAGPPARARALLVHDGGRNRLLVIGGFVGTTALNDLWEWDGAVWSQGSSPPVPTAGTVAERAAYDLLRSRLVLFRLRLNPFSSTQPVEIFEFDGTTWLFRQTVQIGCGNHVAATYDIARAVTVFGDQNAHLEWNGTGAAVPPTTGFQSGDRYFNSDGQFVYELSSRRLLAYDGQELWALSSGPGSVTDLGPGCGAGAATQLTARGEPAPGHGEFAIDVLRCGSSAPFLLGFSFLSGVRPLGSGCSLYLVGGGDSLAGSADPAGNASVALPVPFHFALRGLAFSAQAASLDPQSPTGFRLSSGLRVTIGD